MFMFALDLIWIDGWILIIEVELDIYKERPTIQLSPSNNKLHILQWNPSPLLL